MLTLFATESLVCQLVSWPFAIASCSWQQWMPVVAGLFSALGMRARGIGRLLTFVVGLVVFYLLAIMLVMATPSAGNDDQPGWFLFGCLFLFPIASIIALSGLLGGDLLRIFRKRARENASS